MRRLRQLGSVCLDGIWANLSTTSVYSRRLHPSLEMCHSSGRTQVGHRAAHPSLRSCGRCRFALPLSYALIDLVLLPQQFHLVGGPFGAVPDLDVIARAYDRNLSRQVCSSDLFLRQQDSSLFVPLNPADQPEVNSIESLQVLTRRHLAAHLLRKRPIIPIRIQPEFSIRTRNQEERFAVVDRINRFPDLRRDEHPVLVVDRYVVISIKQMQVLRT